MGRILLKYCVFVLFFVSFATHAHGQAQDSRTVKPNAASIQAGARAYAPGDIIVKIKQPKAGTKSAGEQAFVSRATQQKGMALKAAWGRMGMYQFGLKAGDDVQAKIAEIKQDPEVEYAEPNYYLGKASVAGFSEVISSGEMQAMAAGNYLATNAHIQVTDSYGQVVSQGHVPVVAVIDTGLDTTHSIITGTNALWVNPGEIANNGIDDDGNGYTDDVNGWNFVANSKNMFDDDGHGTHVAGIVLGVGTNIYASPLQPSLIKIMPLKFLDGSGVGKTSDAIKAIYYAVNQGAQVLNNSWGGPSYSAALHEAISYSYSQGVVFVAAAGNNGSNNDNVSMYPASYDVPNVISVAATHDSDAMASFSNFGKTTVHLASPGVYIYSTYPGNQFGVSSGTSMAAPFVAGLAGLMVVEKPSMLGYQVKQLILGNTEVKSGLATKVVTQGRMNVYDTIQATKVASVDGSQPAYAYSIQDRQLASSLATGGCGTVGKLGGGAGGFPGTQSWMIILVVALVSIPFAVYSVMRSRRPENRRKFTRFKIDTEVKVQVGDRELVANLSTISLGGAQLNTNAILEQGGVVKLQISSPDGKEMVDVEGRVVWSEANKAYGVQFQETKASVLDRIGQWSKALTRA
jgi:subtilisin family serine protease